MNTLDDVFCPFNHWRIDDHTVDGKRTLALFRVLFGQSENVLCSFHVSRRRLKQGLYPFHLTWMNGLLNPTHIK